MKQNKYLQEIVSSRPEYIDIFVDNAHEIADRIYFLMEQQGIDQKKLSQLLGKNESEISKWLSGTHNFTFKTAAKIESVLKGKLFSVCENVISAFDSSGSVFLNYKTASFNFSESYDGLPYETENNFTNLGSFQRYNATQKVSISTEIFVS